MSSSNPLRSFIQSNRRHLRFLVLFVVFFFAGQALNYLLFPLTDPLQFHVLNAEAGSHLINLIHPQEKTTVEGRVIRSGDFRVQIAWGCEATDGMITLGAAILALRMAVRRKILGFLMGSLAIYLANLARIVSLYFILKYHPPWYEISHIYIGQIFLILVAILFFVFWAVRFAEIHEKGKAQILDRHS